ncbi:MAG: MBL fold metallo-hydrolase [Pseudomonadota bacterium]
MTSKPDLRRRTLLKAGATLPVATTLYASASYADGHAAPPNSRVFSFPIGDFQLSTMLVGNRLAEDPQTIFALNVDAEEFARVSAQNFLPADKFQFFFTPTVINTGTEVILFDTGLSAELTVPVLTATGLTPDQVDIVVITHMHGDHISGLTKEDGSLTYPNARYVTGQVEFDAWAQMDDEGFNTKVRPLAEKMTFVGDQDAVVSGVSAMAAFGHTPGHMVYMIESQGQQILLLADLVAHHVWSLAYPEWELKFDRDKAAATASRRKYLDMAVADRLPIIGYHLPFPAVGYVDRRDDGFRYVPASYQFML